MTALQVIIKRIERNKRKHVTAIQGLEAFGALFSTYNPLRTPHSILFPLLPGIDLKKAAKLFAQKFATGASVTKNAAGIEEIVVQGDVSQEIFDMIDDAQEEGAGGKGKKGLDLLKGVVIENVDIIEEKKKKATE